MLECFSNSKGIELSRCYLLCLCDCLRSISTRTNAIITSAVPICAVLKKVSKFILLKIYLTIQNSFALIKCQFYILHTACTTLYLFHLSSSSAKRRDEIHNIMAAIICQKLLMAIAAKTAKNHPAEILTNKSLYSFTIY